MQSAETESRKRLQLVPAESIPKSKKAKTIVNLLCLEEAGKNKYSDELVFSLHKDGDAAVLYSSTRKLYQHPPIGAVSRVKINVKEDGSYNFQVGMYSKEKGLLSSDDEYLAILKTMSTQSDYKFCPGLHIDTYNNTLRYLEACNKLFERGFLSHDRVTSEHSQVLKNIDIGMSFFKEWLDCLKKGVFNH